VIPMTERFCIDLRAVPEMDLGEQMRLTKEAGFQNIHINSDAAFITKEQLHTYVQSAKEHGLHVVNLHPPFKRNCEFWVPGPQNDELTDLYLEQIDLCAAFGIESLIVHPTSGPDNVYISELGLETCNRLVQHAEKRGVILLLENLRTPVHLDYLFGNISSKNLQFCFDSGHENAYNRGIGFVRRYGPRMGFTHLHDNNGVDDQHHIPMDESIDWAALRTDMEAVNYTGYLNLEIFPRPVNYDGSDYSAFVRRAFAALARIWGE